MKKATEQDKERLIAYLREDIDNCLYIYIDVQTCGLSSENVTVWMEEEDEEIVLVLMKYYDSFQVYSRKEDVDLDPILEKIEEYKVTMISGPRSVIERLEPVCKQYSVIYGEIFQYHGEKDKTDIGPAEMATEDDARGIAELMLEDEEFARNYTLEDLTKQLADRIRTGQGRSCIVKVDGKVVAHVATFAEADDVVVTSGSVVKKEYRKTDYFENVSDYLTCRIESEGKKLYAFAVNKKMKRWMNYIGRNCGQYGKMQIIE